MSILRIDEIVRQTAESVQKGAGLLLIKVPVWYVFGLECDNAMDPRAIKNWGTDEEKLDKLMLVSEKRGVAFSYRRLLTVLLSGVDVVPSDSCFYTCTDFQKATEYGGMPKIVMFFRNDKLLPTYLQLPKDADKMERETALRDYPHCYEDEDGFYFTRLGNVYKHGTSYERLYARWIRENQRDALAGVMILDHVSEEALNIPERLGKLFAGELDDKMRNLSIDNRLGGQHNGNVDDDVV